MYLWSRLPDDEIADLLFGYRMNDYAKVLTILNRHNVAPDVLTICCSIGEAWEQIEEAIRTEKLYPS